jgi:lipoprotein-releasing system permease protein
MGASQTLIRRIFFAEGMLISFSGAILGMLLGALVCWIQIQFGVVPLHAGGGSFIIDAYPVELQFMDFIYVFLLVLGIGLPAVWYPVRQIQRRYFEQKLA